MRTALLWIELVAFLLAVIALNVSYTPANKWMMPYFVIGGMGVAILCGIAHRLVRPPAKIKKHELPS